MKILISTIITMLAFSFTVVAQNGSLYTFESDARASLQNTVEGPTKHPHIYLKTSNVFMLAVNESRLTLFSSGDGADSFEKLAVISEPNAKVSSHGENSPTMAINGVEYYALWEQNGEGGGSDLMFSRSLRFGRQWEKPIKVTDKTSPSQNGFSYLAVAPNGDIYAVWLDGRNKEQTMDGTSFVYLAKSTDHGATFEKNVQIAKNVCPCCRPTLAFGETGEVYVSWRGVTDGDIRDMMLSASYDNGVSFSQPLTVSHDNWKINGCPHSGASMITKGKRLYISWYSEGNGTNAGIRLVWSDNKGKTFSRPTIASANIVDANHPMLSLSEDGRLLLIFKGRDAKKNDSWGTISPYLCEINNTGSISSPISVHGNRKSISYPVIAAGTVGKVYIAWTETGDKGSNVMLTRARRTHLDVIQFQQTKQKSRRVKSIAQSAEHHNQEH